MPSSAPSVLPSGSLLRSAGILYATQWTKGFCVGASGSSQMIAISLVPWGSELHLRGGETSSPSPVCLFGMVAPASNAGLDTSIIGVFLLLGSSHTGSFERSTQGYGVTAITEALDVVGSVVFREIVLSHRYVNA